MSYDITIWEQIRTRVEVSTRTLVEDIGLEIARDLSLLEYHGSYPVPWQLREIMQQRAQSWIQRLYDPCCDAYKRTGKELSVEFDKAVEDGRNQNPNRAWETLRRLAELRGVIRDGTEGRLPWPKVEKRVQEIRKLFREHFGFSSDPVPFVEGTGYHAKFKISCGPSYRT